MSPPPYQPPTPSASTSPPAAASSRRKLARKVFNVVAVATLLPVALWFNHWSAAHPDVLEAIAKAGYGGVFVVSMLHMVMPVHIAAIFPTLMHAGFVPWLTVLTIASGMTLGDGASYGLGVIGRRHFEPAWPWFRSLVAYLGRTSPAVPAVAMFLYAGFVPFANPVLIVPLAFAGVKARYLFVGVFFGNIVFNLWAIEFYTRATALIAH